VTNAADTVKPNDDAEDPTEGAREKGADRGALPLWGDDAED
jgi:hypothetical protein